MNKDNKNKNEQDVSLSKVQKLMQNKVFKIALIVVIVLVLALAGTLIGLSLAKDNNNNGENNNNGNNDNTSKFGVTTTPNSNSFKIYGLSRDIYFKNISGLNIAFDQKNAATTDSEGKFSFYINRNKDGENVSEDNLIDYIEVDHDDYNFLTVIIGRYGNEMEVVIVVAEKSEDINLALDFRYEMGGKVSFHDDGVELPPGYMFRDTELKDGGVSKNGETPLYGVELWVGDVLINVGNQYGVGAPNITTGTKITFVKPGFNFLVRTSDGIFELEDNTLTITPNMEMIDVRAVIDTDVVTGDIKWWDLSPYKPEQ